MSYLRISKAALFLSIACALMLLFVSLYLLPRGMTAFKKTLYETIVRKASMTFEEETFSDVFKGNVIYVKEVSGTNEFEVHQQLRQQSQAVPTAPLNTAPATPPAAVPGGTTAPPPAPEPAKP